MVLFSSLEHIFTTIKTKFKISIFAFLQVPMGVRGIFRPPVQGGSSELISKFLSSMILYNHSSYFKSGEINSYRLSPIPINNYIGIIHIPEPHLRRTISWFRAFCSKLSKWSWRLSELTEDPIAHSWSCWYNWPRNLKYVVVRQNSSNFTISSALR